MKMRWVKVPIVEPLDHRRCNVFEHTPLDYYRYGEYPRFINTPGAHPPRWEWQLRPAESESGRQTCVA
jgi:hypothetical protein